MSGVVEGRLAEQWTKVRVLHKQRAILVPGIDGPRGLALVCVACRRMCCPVVEWPCPTARIVYTEREIAAALAGTPPQTEDSE